MVCMCGIRAKHSRRRLKTPSSSFVVNSLDKGAREVLAVEVDTWLPAERVESRAEPGGS